MRLCSHPRGHAGKRRKADAEAPHSACGLAAGSKALSILLGLSGTWVCYQEQGASLLLGRLLGPMVTVKEEGDAILVPDALEVGRPPLRREVDVDEVHSFFSDDSRRQCEELWLPAATSTHDLGFPIAEKRNLAVSAWVIGICVPAHKDFANSGIDRGWALLRPRHGSSSRKSSRKRSRKGCGAAPSGLLRPLDDFGDFWASGCAEPEESWRPQRPSLHQGRGSRSCSLALGCAVK
mmetsp:Transcript_33683/g.73712  ORF Transcript_33683/g.73712 Transcript_33683/m.73712 type:complete len:236 (-) Transcript_33683:119-826(-)